MVLTLGVGRNGYISLTGFPTTFIIDMAFLSSTLHVHKARSPPEPGVKVKLLTKTMLYSLIRRLSASLTVSRTVPNGSHRYRGRYHDGRTEYYYDEAADGRIYNGTFKFTRKYADIALGKVVETASGCFASGKKEGKWTFVRKAYGIKRELTAEYAGGKLTGPYSYKSICSSGTAAFNTGVTKIRMRAEDNHPVSDIECDLDGERLTGEYDAEGRPDGNWTLLPAKHGDTNTYHEDWEHGVCTSSYAYDNSVGRKSETKHFITDLVASLVRRDCTPLEKIITKGSSTLTL